MKRYEFDKTINAILFRGKRIDNGEWVYGFLSKSRDVKGKLSYCIDYEEKGLMCSSIVIPETVGQYTGLTDKHGKKIFTGDVVQHHDFGFICQSVVKLGEYMQDGSGGEYSSTPCIGYYVKVNKFTEISEPPLGLEFEEFLKMKNILEVASECEIIGNIHDNPELLNKEGE